MSQYTEAFDSLCGDCEGVDIMSIDESDIDQCIETMKSCDPDFRAECNDEEYLAQLRANAIRGLEEYQEREIAWRAEKDA